MPKKLVSQDRKARIAEMQQQEKARENRVRIRIIAGAAALLVVLGAVVAYAVIDAGKQRPDALISAIGVPASEAACDPVITDKASGGHVEPATVPKVKYTTVPPSSGEHYDQPAVGDRKFFTAEDRPKMEVLVHNLEHGYTVLWYDQKTGEAKEMKADLEEIAKVTNNLDAASGKFIVSAWDPSYGEFPAGKKFALSHWSATFAADKTSVASQAGKRQLCGDLSGAVVQAFIQEFPRTASPEPNAS